MSWKYLILSWEYPSGSKFAKSKPLCLQGRVSIPMSAGYLPRVWYTPHNALLAARVGQLPSPVPKIWDVMDLVVDLLVQVLRWLV